MSKKILSLLITVLAPVLLLAGCTAADPIDHFYTEGITYTDPCYEELVVPVGAMAVMPGVALNLGNMQSGAVFLFADWALPTDEAAAYFTVMLPHNYKEGTDVIVNYRWVFNSDQVGTFVRWHLVYSWANVGDHFAVGSHLWTLSAASNNDSGNHQRTAFTAISGVGKRIGSELICYVERNSSNAADTYTDTVLFLSANVLYQVDSPGSLSQWVK